MCNMLPVPLNVIHPPVTYMPFAKVSLTDEHVMFAEESNEEKDVFFLT